MCIYESKNYGDNMWNDYSIGNIINCLVSQRSLGIELIILTYCLLQRQYTKSYKCNWNIFI